MQWWLSVGAMVMAAASWLTEGAGGTLVIRTDNNPVQPIAIALSGPVEREVPLDGAHAVAVSGLPAGRYEVRPLFVGTVTGAGVHVEVSDGRVTDAPLPLGDVGGVRFDADPGMCEPDHDWTFGFLLPVGANHPANRPSANRPLPTAKTCQREVGGLAPGSYRVQVTPPHRELPAFYTALLVRSGTWTSIRMARPPVVVRGRITSNGDPVAGIRVDIRPMAAPPSIGVAQAVMGLAFTGVTDSDGRYAIGLSTPGTFRQTLRQIGQAELPGIPKQIDLRLGVNHNDLEIGGGTLRVWLTERGATMPPDRPVTLSIQSLPQPPQRRIIANPSEPFDMRVITPGRYVVSATAQSVDSAGRPVTLIAAQQQEVDIRSSLTTDVWIDLIHRDEMWLDVFYADGMPSRGAYVVPHPGAASLRTDDQGRVSLATVPVGTRLPIRTRMFGITCHTVTSDLMQRVVVPDASETLIITVTGSTTPAEGRAILGGATIAGAPGATCPVPFEGFSVAESRGADSVDFKFQLPPGVYTVTLRDGRVLTVPAPGRLEIGETQIR
jgi:hypothetical protein